MIEEERDFIHRDRERAGVLPEEFTETLSGAYRHCASHSRWNGQRTVDLEVEFGRFTACDDALLTKLNGFLGSDREGRSYRVPRRRWDQLLRAQTRWNGRADRTSLVAALRGRDGVVATEAATTVLRALLPPRFDRRGQPPDYRPCFGATTLLRLMEPERFPTLAMPVDLLRGPGGGWPDRDSFIESYMLQARDLSELADRWGIRNLATLDEGIYQCVRCLCEKSRCPAVDTCQGAEVITQLVDDWGKTTREVPAVLHALSESLGSAARQSSIEGETASLPALMRSLMPPQHAVEKALRTLARSGASDGGPPTRFVPALERYLRWYLCEIASELCAAETGGKGHAAQESAIARLLCSERSTVRHAKRLSPQDCDEYARSKGARRGRSGQI